MKKTILKLTAFLLLFTGFFSSCQKEIPPNDPNILITDTKWQLAGFVNAKTGKLKKVKTDNEKCYTLTFNKDQTLSGFSSFNMLHGSYEMNTAIREIHISVYAMTSAGEFSDGELFIESLNKVDFFVLQENELRLYYNNKQKYLFFKPW